MASSQLVAEELAAIKIHGLTREAFLVRATLAAGATYGALSATPYITRALAEGSGGDVDILNYALTLEYLEAEFYTRGVAQVKGLSGDEKKLGGKPAKKPNLDFGGAFADRTAFLKTANVLEDAGVSAYNGAGPLIKSVDVLAAAGSIVQVEARHAALIRLLRDKPPAPLAFDKAASMDAILKKVTPFIKG